MIVELAIGAGLVALGVVTLRTLRRRREGTTGALPAEGSGERSSHAANAAPKHPSKPRREKKSTRHADPRGLRIGDVLLYADTEFWLSGELFVDEEGFVLVVFPTPGALRADYVVQLDEHADSVAFCKETDAVPEGSVPTELPVEGMRLKLKRRGQASVATAGENLPMTSPKASYSVLAGPGGKVLVVLDFEDGDRLALYGEKVAPELYDLLPSSD